MVGYQGIHQSGISVHANTTYKNQFSLEIGYGSDFLNTYTATGKYFINDGLNQFYTGIGYGYFSLVQKTEYKFQISTVHLMLGYQSVVFDNWVIGEEMVLVKYLEQKFRLPNVNYTEKFKWDERIYFEIGVYMGYRIQWDRWL